MVLAATASCEAVMSIRSAVIVDKSVSAAISVAPTSTVITREESDVIAVAASAAVASKTKVTFPSPVPPDKFTVVGVSPAFKL